MNNTIVKSILIAVASSGVMISSAFALNISFESVLKADGTLTTANTNAIVWDFNSDPLGAVTTGSTYGSVFTISNPNDAAIVLGSVVNVYAAPYVVDYSGGYSDATNYLTVPQSTSTGSVTIDLAIDSQYLGMFWGSIDSYNTLTFHYTDGSSETFSGADITFPYQANGDQTSPFTNTYVNFNDVKSFNSITLTSTDYAFEVDNLAVAPVPEPGVTLLFSLGVVGFAGVIRRRKALSV